MTTNPLDEIQARITDCRTYKFGMRNADKLAHEDAPKLLSALRAVEDLLAYWDTLADGDRYYAGSVHARIREALQ